MIKSKKNMIFRRNYEGKISKKLAISQEEFHHDFYTSKPVGLAVLGSLLFCLLSILYLMPIYFMESLS